MAQVTCAARSTNATLGDGMEGMIRGTSLMEPCFFLEQFPKARSNGPSLRNRISAEIDIDTSHDLPKSLQIYDHDVNCLYRVRQCFLDSIEYLPTIGYFRNLLDQPHDVSIRSLFGGCFCYAFCHSSLGPAVEQIQVSLCFKVCYHKKTNIEETLVYICIVE